MTSPQRKKGGNENGDLRFNASMGKGLVVNELKKKYDDIIYGCPLTEWGLVIK